jgi:hypothetical protein
MSPPDAWPAQPSSGEVMAMPDKLITSANPKLAEHRPKRLSKVSVVDFVRRYIEQEAHPTVDGLRKFASREGIIGCRTLYESEYRKQMNECGHIVRPGRPSRKA